MLFTINAAAALSVLLGSGVALAQATMPTERFGDRGEFVISNDTSLSISHASLIDSDSSYTSLNVVPAADYFVIDSLSIGAFLGFGYASSPAYTETSFGVGGRVGYNIPFSDRFSFWPKAGLGFVWTKQELDLDVLGGAELIGDNSELRLTLFAPVLFHPVKHFFLGLGPSFDLDLTGSDKAMALALQLTLGGWI